MINSYAVQIIIFIKLNTTKPVSYNWTGLSWFAKENWKHHLAWYSQHLFIYIAHKKDFNQGRIFESVETWI